MHNSVKILTICLFFSLNAHAGIFDKTLIRSDLRVLEFNDFAEDYLGKASEIRIWGKKKKQTLQISYEPYNIASLEYGAPSLMFVTKHIDTYIDHIQKYLKWEAIATENKDAFGKDIGKAKSIAAVSHKYSFWSGNTTNHYLNIETCVFVSCGDGGGTFYFDLENTLILLNLLNEFKAGNLPPPDVSNKYN
jgi:hypothetical protein